MRAAMKSTLMSAVSLLPLIPLLLSTGCAKQPLRIHADFLPAGSLRLAQVKAFGHGDEVSALPGTHKALLDAGIAEADLRGGGGLVIARVYCCGGPPEDGAAIMAYAPPGVTPTAGDVVEVRVGRPPRNKDDPGQVHVVTRVRHTAAEENRAWRWDPPLKTLWMRTIYADWMPSEGWMKQQKFGGDAWYKPATATPAAAH